MEFHAVIARHSLSRDGFSLFELLVVISIISILAGLVLPALSLHESNKLTNSGQLIVDELGRARQIASSRNQTVEVRLIKLPSLSTGYSGIQLWVPTKSGISVPLDNIKKLSQGMAVSESTTLSPLFPLLQTGTIPSGSATGATFATFFVRPSGIIEPIPSSANRAKLYMTIVPSREASSNDTPLNYVTIQVNPETGTVSVYRP